ncbi:amidohydrolase [Cryobacterium sp. TMS1-20-1]|uniref:amidohydrolase family protein n=1 Tax=Cryobacterium sp. TMS1-20-1 TaxID=1259223 RepID=UPI00106C1351|nr:amidohydrolase [Cryobacterium sp. TMS1-20-1]TFC75905.1 amidohydrolase [Cryobacterium sp. TMS1-20-1]
MTGQSVHGHFLRGRGAVYRGFLDAHVHLALIDPGQLVDGGIARVIDLGGWLPDGKREDMPDVAYAYQFLTAPGGYPRQSGWAEPGWCREIATAADAAAAVDLQAAAGASVLKVTLNAVAGPVLNAEALTAAVGRAHECGLPVVAHAEGAGQADRAFAAGVDAFAHTPFSERLADDLVTAMAASMTWISTLDIHGWGTPTEAFDIASDNLHRFHAAGGRVLYGTDLGNGPLPLGINRREISALLAAGLTPDDVLDALCPRAPLGLALADTRVTFIPGERPRDPDEFTEWLGSARALTHSELEVLE